MKKKGSKLSDAISKIIAEYDAAKYSIDRRHAGDKAIALLRTLVADLSPAYQLGLQTAKQMANNTDAAVNPAAGFSSPQSKSAKAPDLP